MRKSWVILAILTLAGFLVRLFFLRFEFVINPDGVAYTKLAQRFFEGHWTGFLDPYWSPLYPLLISSVMPFSSDLELPGLLISIIFGNLLPIPAFCLARQIYSENEGLIMAGLIAFYGHYLNLSITVTPATVYYFLFALVILLGLKTLENSNLKQAGILGLILGLGYLTRPEAIGYVPVFVVLILSGFWSEKKKTLRESGILAVVLCFSFILIVLPYLVYLRGETGHWTISAKVAPHLIGGNFSEISASGQPQIPPNTLSGTIKTIISTLVFNFHKQHKIFSYLFPPLLIFLAGIGLFGDKWTDGRRKREIYLLILFLTTFVAYLLTVVELIYMGTYLIILFAWTAKGITHLHQWFDENLSEFKWKKHLFDKNLVLFSGLSVILITVYSLPFTGLFRNQEQEREFVWREVKTAGLWLEKNVPPNPKIMAFSNQIAFYARGQHFPFKAKRAEEIPSRSKEAGVDFVVITERTEKDLAGIQDWLNGTPKSIGVKEVFRDESRPGCKLIIYQIAK